MFLSKINTIPEKENIRIRANFRRNTINDDQLGKRKKRFTNLIPII
jgi:hypothetical protein